MAALGLVVGIAKTVAEKAYGAFANRRQLRLTVHLACFTASGTACYFINATNLSSTRDIELTHVWFAVEPPVHAMPPDRPLPKRLKPDETWETWVEASRLPPTLDPPIYVLARARLSTGRVIRSTQDHDVPEFGTVPGGPITRV
jgi:hypothetical protein